MAKFKTGDLVICTCGRKDCHRVILIVCIAPSGWGRYLCRDLRYSEEWALNYDELTLLKIDRVTALQKAIYIKDYEDLK